MNKQDTKIMEYFVTACNFLDGYGLTVTDDDLLRETMTKNFGQFQTIKGLCQEQTLKERDDLLATCKALVNCLSDDPDDYPDLQLWRIIGENASKARQAIADCEDK